MVVLGYGDGIGRVVCDAVAGVFTRHVAVRAAATGRLSLVAAQLGDNTGQAGPSLGPLGLCEGVNTTAFVAIAQVAWWATDSLALLSDTETVADGRTSLELRGANTAPVAGSHSVLVLCRAGWSRRVHGVKKVAPLIDSRREQDHHRFSVDQAHGDDDQ